jgi:3-oxoadipate enol-lactonase
MKVVLLHAFPPDERMWDPQLPGLREDGFEPVAPRLYGRGSSIDGWAAQLLTEVEGPLVAVGASMGGYCALALARRAPERVVGLVLAGSRTDADTPERRAFRDDLISRLRSGGVPAELVTDVPAEELAVAQEAMRDRPDLSGVAASFGGPLLVCVGDADDIVSVDEARAIADAALLGSLEVFEGAGHLLGLEQPHRLGTVLREFMAMADIELRELRDRLDDDELALLDVRTQLEFTGSAQAHCDPRHGHIPGARNLPLERLLESTSAVQVRALVGLPEGAEIVAYCHVGRRSAFAVQVLRAAGYDARNYVGSWHEWSADSSLPAETAAL